jgi:hypothetical protein
MTPPLMVEGEGSPTYNDLNLGAILIFTFPPYDRRGHPIANSISLPNLVQARASNRPAPGLSL